MKFKLKMARIRLRMFIARYHTGWIHITRVIGPHVERETDVLYILGVRVYKKTTNKLGGEK